MSDFAPVPSVPTAPCTTTSCVSIDVSSATPLLTYAVTLRATNAAGLTAFAVSGVYTHVTCLERLDTTVVDVDPTIATDLTLGKLNLAGEDVDIVVDATQLSATWQLQSGTSQVFVAVGTAPGLADIVGFKSAGTLTSYTFGNLTLSNGGRYYVTVAATNLCGKNVSASSDGVVALQGMRQALLGATVQDGSTGSDIDYQISSSTAAANWAFPVAISSHVSHYLWGLMVAGGDNDTVSALRNVGPRISVISGGLSLAAGEEYVSVVQACFGSTCLPPVYSDGFAVAASPSTGAVQMNATYYPNQWDPVYSTSNSGVLQLSWSPFTTGGPPIAFYQWALGTGPTPGQQLLTDWYTVAGTTTAVRADLGPSPLLPALTVITATVVGYNEAGLYAMASAPLVWSGGHTPSPPIVSDVVSSLVQQTTQTDWKQLEYSSTSFSDIDYSSSPSSLSAAWPTLRYSKYGYSVSLTQGFQPCGSPGALACGSTVANSLTVGHLPLQHGRRYYFCVQALASDSTLVTPAAVPGVLTACSNGVTVDLQPPVGGCVQIVPGAVQAVPRPACVNASGFQASVTELLVVWSPFQDVQSSVHISGVAYYQYAIGES